MRPSVSIVAVVVAATILTGCGGTGLSAPGPVPQSASVRHDRVGSWMLQEAQGEDLLYVTNYSDVLVFSYPQGKFVGELPALSPPRARA